jgi:hypothetical protein
VDKARFLLDKGVRSTTLRAFHMAELLTAALVIVVAAQESVDGRSDVLLGASAFHSPSLLFHLSALGATTTLAPHPCPSLSGRVSRFPYVVRPA